MLLFSLSSGIAVVGELDLQRISASACNVTMPRQISFCYNFQFNLSRSLQLRAPDLLVSLLSDQWYCKLYCAGLELNLAALAAFVVAIVGALYSISAFQLGMAELIRFACSLCLGYYECSWLLKRIESD